MLNRLSGTRAYLCGAMDRVADGGIGWRKEIGKFLESRGVVVLDPTDKPIDIGIEDMGHRQKRRELKQAEEYGAVCKDVKLIRVTDLRMVDISDFLVVNIDTDVHACGTYEEITTANRQKKPIVIHVEQGKQHCPDWLLGMIPHELIFSSWSEVHNYLDHIDSQPDIDHLRRWMFFKLGTPTLQSLLKAAMRDPELSETIFDWIKDYHLVHNVYGEAEEAA